MINVQGYGIGCNGGSNGYRLIIPFGADGCVALLALVGQAIDRTVIKLFFIYLDLLGAGLYPVDPVLGTFTGIAHGRIGLRGRVKRQIVR